MINYEITHLHKNNCLKKFVSIFCQFHLMNAAVSIFKLWSLGPLLSIIETWLLAVVSVASPSASQILKCVLSCCKSPI